MSHKSVSTKAVKAPARPAPPPPVTLKKLGNALSGQTTNSTQSQVPQRPASALKKPAPPRPPPPKASVQLKVIQNAISFTGALQRSQQLSSSATAPDLLISWDSPPSSPTQGRWSSDALSLRSFGSDSSGTTATGTFSTMTHSESGFESESDLWSEAGSTNSNRTDKQFTMPTIIRPNRAGKAAQSTTAASGTTHLKALEKMLPSSLSSSCVPDELDASDYSPPEPTIPPPPAPPVFLLDSLPAASAVDTADALPCALALYDYSSPHAGDLNFKEGERIELLAKVNDEWLRGRVGASEGIFPLSYARVVVPLSTSYRAVALYPFQAETDQDLGLQMGDILEVTESKGNGWLYGRCCSTGRWGQFPEAFVQRQDL